MKPKFRIRQTSKGYVVEYRVKRWFRVKWLPFITHLGSETAYPFETTDSAVWHLTDSIEIETLNDWFSK